MHVLSLIHEADAPTGVFADVIAGAGAELEEASIALGTRPSRPPAEYDAVLVMGGGMHVDQADEHPWLGEAKALIGNLIEARVPLLGVCLGSQLVAEAAGAEVGPLPGGPEIGWHEVELTSAAEHDPVMSALPSRFSAFQWHSYGAFTAPPDSATLAANSAGLQA